MQVDEIKTSDTFKIFPINDNILNAIKENMEDVGYDASQPIVLWKDKSIVIDGHTRLIAAKQAGIDEIPVFEVQFADEDEALVYAIHRQRVRRNMTDGDIMRCVEALDRRKEHGGDRRSEEFQSATLRFEKSSSLEKGKSAKQTAELVGISLRKVEQIRTILDYADDTTKQEVMNDKKPINKAYNETQARRKQALLEPALTGLALTGQEQTVKSKSTFNLTNEKIEWAKWTWNPVTGCRGPGGMGICEYCYAFDIANRFYPEKFEPTFRSARLEAPFQTVIPAKLKDEPGIRNVFVCSMGDLFGEWVPVEWIQQVLDVCHASPQWVYIFLTKNPERYLEQFFDDKPNFSDNCWIGATADTQARMTTALDVFYKAKVESKLENICFISAEPLMEELTLHPKKGLGKEETMYIDWLIIGGRSKNSRLPVYQPRWEWVEQLLFQSRQAGLKIYFKPNLTVVPKEYPLPEFGVRISDFGIGNHKDWTPRSLS